jgi:hypothetical protein
MWLYTYIRLRCECGGGVVLASDRLRDTAYSNPPRHSGDRVFLPQD